MHAKKDTRFNESHTVDKLCLDELSCSNRFAKLDSLLSILEGGFASSSSHAGGDPGNENSGVLKYFFGS